MTGSCFVDCLGRLAIKSKKRARREVISLSITHTHTHSHRFFPANFLLIYLLTLKKYHNGGVSFLPGPVAFIFFLPRSCALLGLVMAIISVLCGQANVRKAGLLAVDSLVFMQTTKLCEYVLWPTSSFERLNGDN